MDLFNLTASLSLNLDNYRKGIDTARAAFDNLRSEIEKATKNIEKATQKTQDKIRDDAKKTSEKVIGDTEKTEKETQKSYERMANNASSAFGKIKIAAAAVGAVATAVTAKFIKSSVSAYGEYEQLVGGVETLFKNASDKVIKNAENAFNTAQMSGRQYLQTLTSFSASLLQGIAAADSKAGQMSVEEMSAMLEQQLADKQEYFDKQYSAAEKSYDKSYDALEKSLDAEIEAVEKAADKKIAAINKEYTEKLKLVDEEKYNRLKAIDAQIDAINDQAEAEREAKEKSEYEAKKAELLDTIQNSQKRKRREEAQKDLEQLEADYAQKQTDRQRKSQIEELKNEKEKVKEQYDSKKEALKGQQSAEVNAVKESEKEQLKAMREAKSEQLKALKESNSDKLKELKKQYSEELKLAKKAAQEQLAAFEEGGGVGDYTEEQYQKAAEIGNRAVIDMADNANKMGTSMESIMNAYQGFSKSNYTMLDNLKLGYGGTKTEMQRLIKDASQMIDIQKELGITVDASSLSFDNIVNAISVMQKKLDISGTSAKEAAETIQGSIGRMGAAWDNLIVGLGDKEQDVKALVDKFVETVVGGTDESGEHIKGFFDNLAPIAEQIVSSLPSLIEGIGQAIENSDSDLLTSIITAVGKTITTTIVTLTRLMPSIVPQLIEGLKQVIQAIGEALPEILSAMSEFAQDGLPTLLDGLADIIIQLVEFLTTPENINAFIDVSFAILDTMLEGIFRAIPRLLEALPTIVGNLVKALLRNIPKIAMAGVKLLVSLVSNLPEIIKGIVVAIPQIIQAIFKELASFGYDLGKIFFDAWQGVQEVFANAGDFFGGVWDSIQAAFGTVGSVLSGIFSDAWDAICEVFSPVGEMFGNIGESILNGLSSVINGIIWGINQVIKVPFDGLNAILRTIKDINIAGLKPFSWIGEIPVPQIPSIPMLAEGGVLKRGQIALLEGQGDEAVIPLSKNTEWMDGVADRISDRLNNDGNQNITYNIHVDVGNMSANSKEDIDALAEILIQAIAEKTARRRVAF